jgi:hypothetical protein
VAAPANRRCACGGATRSGLSYAGVGGPPQGQVAHPYRPAPTGRDQDYADTVLPIFDAALGIGAPFTPDGEADCQALTAPWRRVCLPTRFTAATAYGPQTQTALSVLRFAAGLPARSRRTMIDERAGIEEQVWQQAGAAVDAASVDSGFPYRARCLYWETVALYWETVAAAEHAAGESPTDTGLVRALGSRRHPGVRRRARPTHRHPAVPAIPRQRRGPSRLTPYGR